MRREISRHHPLSTFPGPAYIRFSEKNKGECTIVILLSYISKMKPEKTTFAILLPTVFLLAVFACQNETNVLRDSPGNATAHEPPAPEYVVLPLDTFASTVVWKRHKTWKNMETTLKLGKTKINVQMDHANISTSGTFRVLRGQLGWRKETGMVHGEMYMDLTRIVALQVNKDEKLKLRSPDYLNVEKYPTAELLFTDVPVNCDTCEVNMILKLKGKNRTLKGNVVTELRDEKPFLVWVHFTIDGKEAGLIPVAKMDQVKRDSLVFQCGFQTEAHAL